MTSEPGQPSTMTSTTVTYEPSASEITRASSWLKKIQEAIEAEQELAESFFENGNVYYWATLSIFIVGAVVHEFYERRFGVAKHLDRRLAVPQGIRRGLPAGLGLGFAWAVDNQPWGYALCSTDALGRV